MTSPEAAGVHPAYRPVLAASAQIGDNVVITLDENNTITMLDVNLSSLQATDFLTQACGVRGISRPQPRGPISAGSGGADFRCAGCRNATTSHDDAAYLTGAGDADADRVIGIDRPD